MSAIARALCIGFIAFFAASAVEARPGTPVGASHSPAAAHAPEELVHVVQVGQYLSIIAKRYHTSSEAIRKTNGLAPNATLKPGTTLRIAVTPEHATWREHNEPRSKKEEPNRTSPIEGNKKHEHHRGREENSGATTEPELPDRGGKGPQEPAPSKLNADKWKRRPPRSGYVVASRFTDTFRGQLRASNGSLVPKSAEKVDWLLRSSKTNEHVKMDRRLLKLVAQVSDHFGGREVVLVSGFRPYSPRQFTKNSRHNHGEAVDFRIAGVPNIALYEYCLGLPLVGCGYYPNSLFIHLDVRLLKTRWVDYSGPGEAPRYSRKAPVDPDKAGQGAPMATDAEEEDDPEPDDE